MKPIFIPTKGRHENCKTAKLLGNLSNLYLVIEPDEEENYRKNYNNYNYIILPKNNMGLAYARNYILNFCKKMNYDWFWMLDDDISAILRREGTKLIKDVSALYNAEKLISKDTGQLALEYQQFAWSCKKDYILNSYADVCVCINVRCAIDNDLKFRDEVCLKLDRDFTMQIIKSGYKIKRTTLSAFSAPKNGSNKGGLKYLYDKKNKELSDSKKMVEIWGDDICRLNIKKDGRPDVKIFWKNINKKQLNLF